jgi:outer membrane protein TolC
MKIFLIGMIIISGNSLWAQSLAKVPDSVRKVVDDYNMVNKTAANNISNLIDNEDILKDKLVKLAFKNAGIIAADANIRIAEISRKKANSSFLSSVNLGANVNEFVVNNSPAANFFPKYNLGVTIPLDLFAKNKAEKNTADQMIIFNSSQKELLKANIKARVLIQYETYKEKKELVELQKMAMEEDIDAYERAQQDFKDEVITLEELNKIFKSSVYEKAILATKEKDLRIAIIQMEELIGVPFQKVLQK